MFRLYTRMWTIRDLPGLRQTSPGLLNGLGSVLSTSGQHRGLSSN